MPSRPDGCARSATTRKDCVDGRAYPVILQALRDGTKTARGARMAIRLSPWLVLPVVMVAAVGGYLVADHTPSAAATPPTETAAAATTAAGGAG